MLAEELEPAEVPEQELPVGECERLTGERESVSQIERAGGEQAPA